MALVITRARFSRALAPAGFGEVLDCAGVGAAAHQAQAAVLTELSRTSSPFSLTRSYSR